MFNKLNICIQPWDERSVDKDKVLECLKLLEKSFEEPKRMAEMNLLQPLVDSARRARTVAVVSRL